MNLKLNTFEKEMTAKERKASSFVQSIELSGPLADDQQLTEDFLKAMDSIFINYEMDEDSVFRLKDNNCKKCHHKLVIKDEYRKEINLPGGSSIFLDFYRYSCPNCDEPVDRKLGNIFEPNKQYSKNIKADAVKNYSRHLSNYDAVTEEINEKYKLNIGKKTIMNWIKEEGFISEKYIMTDKDFSGHIVYDEEYMKVFFGDVGISGSNLKWTQIYLLLFRDAITKKCIIQLVDSLSEEVLLDAWTSIIQHLNDIGVQVISFGTDGKREYPEYIQKINRNLGMKIRHVYDVFHFKKNLFESANEEIFGVKYTKKELPEHVINQIELINKFFEQNTKDEAKVYLKEILLYQKLTLIKNLRQHINRLNNYFDDYTYSFEVPQMKTTNLCESWFHQTKPEKLKHGYKTMEGLQAIANLVAVRINYNLKEVLNLEFDYTESFNILLGTLKAKMQL